MVEPGKHPPHIRVHHRHPLPVGECGNGPGGVIANAGQSQQIGHIRRHHTIVVRHNLLGAFVQAERAPRVPETPPGAQHIVNAGRSEVGGGGPTVDPLQPYGFHAGDLGLLAHDFAEQHTPRGGFRGAPGNVAGVGSKPRGKPAVQDGSKFGGLFWGYGNWCGHDC